METTIHSDWDDWLPRAVADAAPDGLRLWYLGCNGFVCKAGDAAGTTLFIDPYCGTGTPPHTTRMIPVPFDPADVAAADAVLATHEHSDHVHAPTQAPLVAAGAAYYAPEASMAVVEEEAWLERYDLDPDRLQTVAPGETVSVGPISVTVTAANDPDAVAPVGYLIEYDGHTFYHGGDARPGAPFEQLGAAHDVDLAALAFGSAGYIPTKDESALEYTTWYADENEVLTAAEQVGARRLVPTHWDMWRGLTADPTALHDHARSFDRPARIEILEIGDDTAV